jgi:hypothetical protein
MQAIVTKYHGPTNTRGSRVTAIADAGRVTLPWNDALSMEANHDAAALALCAKFGWNVPHYGKYLQRGGMPKSSPYAYCYVSTGGKLDEYDRVKVPQVKP